MIEVRCFHDLSRAEVFREGINALNLASARPDPFSTFEFFEHSLRHLLRFAEGEPPRVWLLLAFDDRTLVGVLALKQSVHRVLGVRAIKLDWLTAFRADRPHLIARPEHATAVAAAITGYLWKRNKEWSLLEFQQQDAASPLRQRPADVAAGSQFHVWPNLESGTLRLRWDSLASYFAELSHKFRSNVSRQMRTLLAAGEVQVLTSSDPQSLPALFELYRDIEPHSWKQQADASIGRDRSSLEYYTGLMDPAQPMRIVIQVLLLDGVPITGLINGLFNNDLYALHIVYDDRLARLGPGSAILLMGVRLAIEGRYDHLHLLQGAGYYKTRWLAQMTETHSVQIYRAGSPFYWRRVLGDCRRRWFERPAATARSVLFNPVRRDIGTVEPDAAADASMPMASAENRLRYAALVAQVCRGPGEFLNATQLAAAMPFDTQRRFQRAGSAPAGGHNAAAMRLPAI